LFVCALLHIQRLEHFWSVAKKAVILRRASSDGYFSLLIAYSFDPTRTYPEFANDSAESTKEEKQTQGREKDREHEDEPR